MRHLLRNIVLLSKGQLVDFRPLRLLKDVWSSPGAWRPSVVSRALDPQLAERRPRAKQRRRGAEKGVWNAYPLIGCMILVTGSLVQFTAPVSGSASGGYCSGERDERLSPAESNYLTEMESCRASYDDDEEGMKECLDQVDANYNHAQAECDEASTDAQETIPSTLVQLKQAALEAATTEHLGTATWVPMPTPRVMAAQQTTPLGESEGPSENVEDPDEPVQFISVEVRTGSVIRHRFDRAALAQIYADGARLGLNRAAPPHRPVGLSAGASPSVQQLRISADDNLMAHLPEFDAWGERRVDDLQRLNFPSLEPVKEVTTHTWSNGVDNRARLGYADGWGFDDFYLAPIGQITNSTGGSCSGTLMGRRVIMTAAHCLVQQSPPGSWTAFPNLVFTPRRDTTGVIPGPSPWGTQALTQLWVPAQYWDGTCSGESGCNKYDIGFAVVADTFNGHPGWYGFNGNLSGSFMGSQYTFMRGYPACTGADAPPTACTAGTAYGDVVTDCDVGNGSAFSYDSNDQAREMRFKCDGSRGMSGSAIFTQNCPGIGRCAFGQYNQFICTGSACKGKTWVNTMGRLTKIYAQVLAARIAANP